MTTNKTQIICIDVKGNVIAVRRYKIEKETRQFYNCRLLQPKQSSNTIHDMIPRPKPNRRLQRKFKKEKHDTVYNLNYWKPAKRISGCIYFIDTFSTPDETYKVIKDYIATLRAELYNHTNLSIETISRLKVDSHEL